MRLVFTILTLSEEIKKEKMRKKKITPDKLPRWVKLGLVQILCCSSHWEVNLTGLGDLFVQWNPPKHLSAPAALENPHWVITGPTLPCWRSHPGGRPARGPTKRHCGSSDKPAHCLHVSERPPWIHAEEESAAQFVTHN